MEPSPGAGAVPRPTRKLANIAATPTEATIITGLDVADLRDGRLVRTWASASSCAFVM
nr:hypothetical protein GCM10010200_026960 [Actinomadura rugatobispora]